MRTKLKKWRLVLILGVLLGVIIMPAIAENEPVNQKEYTFRKTTWGMNREQVKKTEIKEVAYEDEKILGYEGKIVELDCNIVYIFAGGKLVRTKYVITEKHSNKNEHITDYGILKAALIKKYGKPLEFEEVWKNDLYKDYPQDWGTAISIGHLIYMTEWETLQTSIILSLDGDNHEIMLAIQYRSKELGELEEKEKERKALEEL